MQFENTTKDSIIGQAAKDYDIDINTVKIIFDQGHDQFYENLEDYINERAT